MLPNLTCPELKPQAHFEHRHPRDCSHSHFELRNVAVARVLGTSEMVHVYKAHAKRLLGHTTLIIADVLWTCLIFYVPLTLETLLKRF